MPRSLDVFGVGVLRRDKRSLGRILLGSLQSPFLLQSPLRLGFVALLFLVLTFSHSIQPRVS